VNGGLAWQALFHKVGEGQEEVDDGTGRIFNKDVATPDPDEQHYEHQMNNHLVTVPDARHMQVPCCVGR
jgi:hypothetical protein